MSARRKNTIGGLGAVLIRAKDSKVLIAMPVYDGGCVGNSGAVEVAQLQVIAGDVQALEFSWFPVYICAARNAGKLVRSAVWFNNGVAVGFRSGVAGSAVR